MASCVPCGPPTLRCQCVVPIQEKNLNALSAIRCTPAAGSFGKAMAVIFVHLLPVVFIY